MCGIAGIINKSHLPVARETIVALTRSVVHRGPDDEGFFFGPGLAFGHRRLIIQDLSNDGHQPMATNDERCVLIYNGEVYNFLELRRELEGLGRVFQSRCDTEVVLQAYQEWGEGCVDRFNGMWAFAIYDVKSNKIFCSRDRFGIKPFYYVNSAATFVFGSEIKQLLSFLPKVSVNDSILLNFILTAIADYDEQTFFQDVLKLPAGHNLTYDLQKNTITIKKYYRLRPQDGLATLPSGEAVAHFKELLQKSISLRLRSDVRVGTCLSGGLDSSSVATLAALQLRGESEIPFAAITAVSTQANNDESGYAKSVVDNSGLEWFPVCPSFDDFQGVIRDVARIQEEPFCGPSLVMQYFVMAEARKRGITVLLDGQGGDEILLGYPKYYAAYLLDMYLSKGLRKAVCTVKDILRADANMSIGKILKYTWAGLSASSRYRYYCRTHSYLKDFPPLPDHLNKFSRACRDIFALQELENFSTNLPVLLRYEDKNSMAHSIETRLPFLDYQLVEATLSFPGTMKIRNGWTKWLLREAMKTDLPQAIAWRRDKYGFEAPEQQWLPRHLEQMKKIIFASPLLNQYCDIRKLKRVFLRLDSRSRWRLYSVALWEQEYSVSG